LIEENDITVVVVGLPLSLDGTIGPAGKSVLAEVKSLRKRLDVDVVTHDERLSTVTAESSLRAQGVGTRKGRSVVDSNAN
jgi:putative Holliday junction resolvase